MTDDHTRLPRDADNDDWASLFRPGDGGAACPPPELVQAARESVLPPGLQKAITEHVRQCAVCRALGDSLDAFPGTDLTIEESKRIRQRIPPSPVFAPQSPGHWLWSGIAAAAIVIVFGSWMLFWRGAGPGAALVPLAAAEQLSVFELGPPPFLPAPTAAVDPPESASSVEAAELTSALAPYHSGNFRETKRLMTAFVGRHPESVEAHFYLGVSELFLSSNADAVSALETARRLAGGRADVVRETMWYLALANRRLGRSDRAWELLASLCRGPHGGSMRACTGLGELAPPIRLSGSVTDVDGRPIADARIVEHSLVFTPERVDSFPTHFSGTTDAAGRYTFSGVPWSASGRLLMRASKPGFFTAAFWFPHAPDMAADFRLYPLQYIALGEAVRGTTRADPVCERPTEPCQRFAVVVQQNGTLEVSVTASPRKGMDVWIEAPDGVIYGPWVTAPLRLAVPVAAGLTYQLRVLSMNEPREFALTTRLSR